MPYIILDRDGVINHDSPDFIRSPDQWQPIPGSLEAMARLCHSGYRIVLITNQSGISRGLFDVGTLHDIHEKMLRELAVNGGSVEAVFFCPDKPESESMYRKPAPGMFEDLARRARISLGDVPAVGDRLADVEAARATGAKPVLVRTGHGKETAAKLNDPTVPVFDDLAAFVDDLLSNTE
jgi:D-glycero-D-manno-heptose 1,7-bisphosphate phosphatase